MVSLKTHVIIIIIIIVYYLSSTCWWSMKNVYKYFRVMNALQSNCINMLSNIGRTTLKPSIMLSRQSNGRLTKDMGVPYFFQNSFAPKIYF